MRDDDFISLLEIATVITAYTAAGPAQLSLVPGQYIAVKAKNADGWWEGQLQVPYILTIPR